MDLLGLFSFRKDEPQLPLNSNVSSRRELSDLLDRLGDLKAVRARDVMIPRALVEAIDMDVEVGRLHVSSTPHSLYFPVYAGDLDRIRGWIGQETLRNLAQNGYAGNLSHEYIPAEFVPEDMPLDKVFLKFVKSSAPLFVVQNAAGFTAGVLYLSDVLEVFFGMEIESSLPLTIASDG